MIFVISSCTTRTSTDPLDYPIFTPEPGPTITASSTTTFEAASQAIQPPYSIWIDPLFTSLQNDLLNKLELFEPARSKSDAVISISTTGSELAGTWTYLAVAPFYALQDDLEITDLITFWLTGEPVLPDITHIYLTNNTVEHLTGYWGSPKASIFTVTTSDKLMDLLWYDPGSIAIVPFEAVSPGYKILSIDGMFPLDPGFQSNIYGLSFPIYYSSPNVLFQDSGLGYQLSNYDQSKLTSVALTGVTALVRATAAIMEEKGILYPAGDIQEILVSADITHISNEVPFAENCPPPNPAQESLYFCSDDRYIQLLEAVGTDIVELSGDHFGDWGPEAMFHSLDLYHDRDWIIYGGGETLQAGLDPVYLEHNGNKIVFIGCNGKVHDVYATASETNPGASRCNFEWMIPEITRLSEEGYLVIATMQHEEIDSFFSVALQRYDFRRLREAGAVIVSGSQAHHPQGIEITETCFIHYGLGNLFFDQWYLANYNPTVHLNKDKAFIDIHYFYDGRHISTKLVPLQFIDNARPRLMTPEEKEPFLGEVFKASLWQGRWIYLFPAGYLSKLED